MSPSGTSKSPVFTKEEGGMGLSVGRWDTVEHATLVDAQRQSR